MKNYLELLQEILEDGNDRGDRTGVGTRALFARSLRFDLTKGIPFLTTKRIFVRGVIHELLWMLRGDTNVAYLQDRGVHIWDQWADSDGDLGPVYGKQWRSWGPKSSPWLSNHESIDQIQDVIDTIRTNPTSRRMLVSAWNVSDLPEMRLSPCHCLFQLFVADGRLSCQLYQRSADVFLGVPFNIASYALLTMMIAQVTGLEVGEFVHVFGDVHLYSNHHDQAREQLACQPRQLPTIEITPRDEIDDFVFDDFKLIGYDPHPRIKAEVAV